MHRRTSGAGSNVLFSCVVFIIVSQLITTTHALRRPSSAAAVNNPVADPKAVVVAGNARFTVLTSRLIRLEWAANALFEDRASFAVINRHLPVPTFSVSNTSTVLTITTNALTLTYKTGGSSPLFASNNLAISLNGTDGIKTVWNPGMINTGNLLGTIRTLDGANGSIELDCAKQTNQGLHCTYGLISTLGWNVVDETRRPLFTNDTWPWAVARGNANLDWYFMGHGHNYEQALYEFTMIAGKIPLPPRFTFGLWWSRYWAYSDIEFMDLVSQYEMHEVPLDVLVIDMDWHLTFYKEADAGKRDQAGQPVGWTGYTWDPQLFPNPDSFLEWVHSKGLKSTLNLHPASGVQPFEKRYPQMAVASGIDPATHRYVPFDIFNKTYARNLYNIMLHPLEQQGINFWWLDWQQGEDWGNITGVNPTFWLNYVFFTNPDQWTDNKRPLLFHRWGGLGNHRYQIGFTGDVEPSWASLTFQTYFTATAANVAYGYWSHDIGGHLLPPPSPELYTRWVQWGAFAPVLRTHATKNPINERRIWAYPLQNFFVMRDAFVLRASLIPYTYTAARIAYDTGLSLIRGLYYSWPTFDEAYRFQGEYLFGDDMVVHPVTAPGDVNGLTQMQVWIPPGQWIEWFSGVAFTGPQTITRQFALADIPVYVKAGAIVPLESPKDRASLIGGTKDIPTTLTFVIFASSSVTSAETNVYEDDGNSNSYLSNSNGQFAWTTASYKMVANNRIDVMVYTNGSFAGLSSQRKYRITFKGAYAPQQIVINGNPIPNAQWSYDGDQLSLEVETGLVSVKSSVHVSVTFARAFDNILLSGLPLAFKRLAFVKTLLDNQWPSIYQEDYDHVVLAASTGQRITDSPNTVATELAQFAGLFSAAVDDVKSIQRLSSSVRAQALALLNSAQPRTASSLALNKNSIQIGI